MSAGAAAIAALGFAERTVVADAAGGSGVVAALAIAGLCDCLGHGGATGAAGRIAAAAAAPDWTAADLATALVAAESCVRLGLDSSLGASDYLLLLREAADETEQSPRHDLVRLALEGAGETAAPVALLHLPASRLRTGVAADTASVLAEIERAAGYGTRSVEVTAVLGDLLDGAAVAAFERYDLALMMRLMRARAYCRTGSEPMNGQMVTLLQQLQDIDGGFGDLGSVCGKLERAGSARRAGDMRLHVAFRAIWTLTDVELGGTPLFARLFAAKRPSVGMAEAVEC